MYAYQTLCLTITTMEPNFCSESLPETAVREAPAINSPRLRQGNAAWFKLSFLGSAKQHLFVVVEFDLLDVHPSTERRENWVTGFPIQTIYLYLPIVC